jgi:hypothetical protein
MKMTEADEREIIVARSTYGKNLYYLQTARAALCRRIALLQSYTIITILFYIKFVSRLY